MSQVEAGYQKDVAIWKRIEGIVRHYHVPNSDHCPYSGILQTEEDKESDFSLQSLLNDFPDGEHITINIESHGTHPNAKGYIWILTKPHTYERVPLVCKDCKVLGSCSIMPDQEAECPNETNEEVPLHAHLAYFGSELECKLCNPVCHDEHKYGDNNRLAWCGNPKCPMNPNKENKDELILYKDELVLS